MIFSFFLQLALFAYFFYAGLSYSIIKQEQPNLDKFATWGYSMFRPAQKIIAFIKDKLQKYL